MSLGINVLWKARPRLALVKAFSLVPRESQHLLQPVSSVRSRTRRWLSSSTEPPPLGGKPEQWTAHEFGDVGKADGVPQDEAAQESAHPRLEMTSALPPTMASSSSSSSSPFRVRGNVLSRHKIKQMRGLRERFTALIKRPVLYSSRYASRRSLWKHRTSVKKQIIHEHSRGDVFRRPVNTWFSTLEFMIRNTPKYGDILDFKVVIGKGAAAQARSALSEFDSNLWDIQKRHHCHIRMGRDAHNTPLVLILSGTNISVRAALVDLVKIIGKVSAIRIRDPALESTWKDGSARVMPIRILDEGDRASPDETITVYGQDEAKFVRMARRPEQKLYDLHTRADLIARPTVWNRYTFAQYVSRLVLGRVPTYLHKSLYSVGPDHQTTVIDILTQILTAEELRSAVSVSALNMALRFILSRGPAFRPAAWTIFNQAEQLRLPLDAETFHIFLVSASTAGDLESFNSTLRAMQRKGHYVRSETWGAFISMIQNPQVKYYTMKRMKSRGLFRLEYILQEVGRQNVMINLERRFHEGMRFEDVLDTQDKRYGPGWLNTITLNKMLDLLGAQGNLSACHELLGLAEKDGRVRPDIYTLNTMLSHTRVIPMKIALLSRWPHLSPDSVAYQQMFQTAWKARLPNMLRVIWRYAVFANETTSQMRHNLTKLLYPSRDPSNKRVFLDAWKDVILGRSEVARLVPGHTGRIGAAQLMKLYAADIQDPELLSDLATKLGEAYGMDMKIHKLRKEGGEISASTRDSLTVDIPVGDRRLVSYVPGPDALVF
ncbi:hypothetical protein F4861DRAFT_502187 [Xylaria intraflava]|nr:hypothetical protein F4861DRAFT_502187 [Xylaria intraflava]